MKRISAFALLLALSSIGLVAGGCAKQAATETAAPAVTDSSLTQAEADKRIQEVNDNNAIPADAKQGIIDGYQARVKE